METKLGAKELSERIERNSMAIAIRARRLYYPSRRKGADVSLARDFRRSGRSNVVAVRHHIEVKLSIIKVNVKCAFLVQEVNDRLVFYRFFNCSSESGRRYLE